MTRVKWVIVVLAAGLVGIALAGAGKRQEPATPITGAILTEKEAFIALPPEVIVPGGTQRVSVSPDGKFVLIHRAATPPPKSPFPDDPPPKWGEISLVLWNAATRRTSVLWKRNVTEEEIQQPAGLEAVRDIHWLPQSAAAILRFGASDAEGNAVSERLVLLDAARGTLRNSAEMDAKDQLYVSRDRPLAALMRTGKNAFQIIGANGVPGRLVPLSDPAIVLLGWLPEGKGLFGVRPRAPKDAPEAERKKPRWAIADIATGAVTSVEKRPVPADAAPPPPPTLTIRAGRASLKEGDATADVSPLWLEGATKEAAGRVLIAPDGEQPELLPTAALYQRHETLFAVPIIRMDRATYAKLQTEMQRRQTLANAKQIALALIMYAQDYDENFPPPGDGKGIAEVADPYLKNISVFNDISTGKFGFTPAYKSVSLSAFSDPAHMPLGYLTGPGGRVIIFVDGHAAWE